jgi:hypothetical protein
MPNRFGTDILIQADDPRKAAFFYVEHLGFEITDDNPDDWPSWREHQSVYRARTSVGTGVGAVRG